MDSNDAVLRERSELAERLCASMYFTTNMPQCQGLGHASLIHKVRLVLHIFWMMARSPKLASLVSMAQSVVAV
eukprot:15120895-Alexandrium_andersonii.AAC.1